MKKVFSFALSMLTLLLTICFFVSAEDYTITEVEYLEDGSYFVTTVSKQINYNIASLFAKSSSITRTKSTGYYDSNGDAYWTASITATFTYNGTTSSCTTVSESKTIYNSSWRCTAANCYKSGATATGDFTFKRYASLIPVQTINRTLTLTCDKNGNVT